MMKQKIIDMIREYYIDLIPFNKVLGISIDLLDYDTGEAVTSFDMRKDLVGNYAMGILHGGVTSSVIDLTGGLSALLSCARQNVGQSIQEIGERLTGSATIDLRVDYLRPGKGKAFRCQSTVIRAGNRIVVSNIDLFNEKNIRIATGTGTYLISR